MRTSLQKKKQTGFTGNTNTELKEVCNHIQLSYNEYKKVVKDSKERGVAFINNIAKAKVKTRKIRAANALKVMEEHEKTRAS